MDVEPLDHYHGARRRMRRPVAGGLPYSSPLPIVEDQHAVPGWVYFAIGGGTVALAMIGAAWAALAWWIDRVLGKT